jgi:hypothetical protein
MICGSRLPPPNPRTLTHGTDRAPPIQPTSIPGGDTPITSPTPAPIRVRRSTILGPEAHENHSHEHLGIDGYFLAESGPISRSLDSPTRHHESEPIHVAAPPHREDHASSDPVTPSLSTSQPLSVYSYRPDSQYSAHRAPSQYSHHSHLDGAEAAARGYTPPYPECREPRTPESINSSCPSTAISFGPALPAPSKDRLRPMIGIDRYGKQKAIVVEDTVHRHVFPPVTTRFVR